ncbi:hypothetical protein REPUB_Repub04eG0255000 [Reevesia pubescens]
MLQVGRSAPMNEEGSDVKLVRGILYMGRYSDPDGAQSSFSILLGDALYLDGQFAIFGKVTKGDETLRKLEELPTRREGIFVMPVERILWHFVILLLCHINFSRDNFGASTSQDIVKKASHLVEERKRGGGDWGLYLERSVYAAPVLLDMEFPDVLSLTLLLEAVTSRSQWSNLTSARRLSLLVGHCSLYTELESCETERGILKRRLAASAVETERQRMKCFP